jgi:hypothetical protein
VKIDGEDGIFFYFFFGSQASSHAEIHHTPEELRHTATVWQATTCFLGWKGSVLTTPDISTLQ